MKPKTYLEFEKMVRHFELSPVCKVVEDDGTEILIADGFVEPRGEVFKTHFSEEYPEGLYQTLWGIYRGKFDVAAWVQFDHDHEPNWTEAARQEGRVNAALNAARIWIRTNKETGRYAA